MENKRIVLREKDETLLSGVAIIGAVAAVSVAALCLMLTASSLRTSIVAAIIAGCGFAAFLFFFGLTLGACFWPVCLILDSQHVELRRGKKVLFHSNYEEIAEVGCEYICPGDNEPCLVMRYIASKRIPPEERGLAGKEWDEWFTQSFSIPLDQVAKLINERVHACDS